MDRKYELLETGDCELFRIRALRDFGNVKAGDIGGLVESDMQLSHDGNCWIYDGAEVSEDAEVREDAVVCGAAVVHGHAVVCGNAVVHGRARVYGNAVVYEDAEVCEDARVYGHAEVCVAAEVHGHAVVCGNAKVYGDAKVHGNSKVCGNAIINCGEVGEKANIVFPMEKIDFDFSILPDNVQSIKIDGKSYEKRLTWVEV